MRYTPDQVTTGTAELDSKIEIATERIQELEDAHDKNMNISAAGYLVVGKLVEF